MGKIEKIATITLAIYLSAFFVITSIATKEYKNDATKRIGLACEEYVCDVVDETEFWSVCDSTKFNMYEENTTEWYIAVVQEYLNNYENGNQEN